ncbi:Dihydrolipoyllysine-residue acetyltransferase component of acetoin cleaving system [Ensifer psoraleae]|uniref:alpha/beta fold hydrolase n=1 Tax=Sinorhizobium psoraleae TaxID=520838 RepID=UPI00156876E5|nr:alpha/beta hydrolase [Sinorhizobium psoraleae]NRP74350.1 Dihydrolipoyllysine-residue acetyltransferase component of acetoin cleaving system [Sinorhizobium psoraleae]
MALTTIDGIATRYEVLGSGPPLLMYSPGGFDATIEKWRTQGIYAEIQFLEQLPEHFTCITFDRRETGQSGGRVERVTWSDYVRQGKGLLDHLGIDKAYLMGGCMGCCVVAAFAAELPESVLGMVLFWPVGGARYRIAGHQRFAEHLAFVHQNNLEAVVALAKESNKAFGADPRGGPWVSVLRHDPEFAERYVRQNVDHYKAILAGMPRTLLDRDTSPGAEPEDLLRLNIPTLIIPGADASHATSAARYLQECIPGSQYWDVPVLEQTSAATNARVIEFLRQAEASRNG